jgi:leucyl aminopeptidase
MSASSTGAPIACRFLPLQAVDVDLLVLPWFQGESQTSFVDLDRATAGEIARGLASGEFGASPSDLFVTPVTDRAWSPRRVALIGAGPAAGFDPGLARKLAIAAGLAARTRRAGRVGFVVRPGHAAPSGDVDVAGFVQAIAEGLTFSEFDGATRKSVSAAAFKIDSFTIVVPDFADSSPESPARLEGATARGQVLGHATNLARALVNEPGNLLTPQALAEQTAQIVSDGGGTAEILDEKAIASLGMGLMLGVARGSSEPPRLAVFKYSPPGVKSGPVLGLVGKGITFDSGGISIKPADGMAQMKDDMAGGAAVASALHAIARLQAPIRVVGVLPATENMPGGNALKPGDVLKSAEGKTVEVTDTDYEGRLVLGDALWYARRAGATHLVDVATLTSSIVAALGHATTGLFGTPDWWVDHVRRVGDRTGDRMWPLPLFDDYRDQLKSDIADMTNFGGRPAGAITGALFLKEFSGGLPWAHLDIAGTAWATERQPFMPKGATGVGVRTLTELAFTANSWK